MKNQNIKNLIVAVDLSTHSKVVVKQAQEMARYLKVNLTYVYVFEDIAVFDEAFDVKKKKITDYYNGKIRKEYLLSEKDLVIVRYGRAYEEIIGLAKNFAKPMILAGHQASSLTRLFLGSTVERIALCSPFPVWIHRSSQVSLPKKILVPCDLTEESAVTIAKADLFKIAFKAKLEIFHVMQEPTPILDYQAYSEIYQEIQKSDDRRLKSFKKKHPLLKTVRAKGGVIGKIQERAKAFDVLALSPRNHKNSVALFGSVTAKLIRSGDTPILVLP